MNNLLDFELCEVSLQFHHLLEKATSSLLMSLPSVLGAMSTMKKISSCCASVLSPHFGWESSVGTRYILQWICSWSAWLEWVLLCWWAQVFATGLLTPHLAGISVVGVISSSSHSSVASKMCEHRTSWMRWMLRLRTSAGRMVPRTTDPSISIYVW